VGYDAVTELLGRRAPFTALFACSDILAMGAAAALREAGISVPREVSLVGWDDIPLASFMNPPLTTIHTAADETARHLKRLLRERIEGIEVEKVTKVSTRLVIRLSTAPVGGNG
jgi:LacI family asc operon transcriptional repressor